MTYVITEACIGVKDQSCMEVCPESCVFSEDIDDMSYIDPNRCIDCGVCMEACAMGAIYPDFALPKASLEFLALNDYWFKHKTGVRARVLEIAADVGSPIAPQLEAN